MGLSVKPKILVTRPQPGADQTAARLKQHGFEAVVLPFTEMVPVSPTAELPDPTDTQALVVTSANAIRYARPDLIESYRSVPVYAVGDATKQAAVAAGFSAVQSANGNAQDLVTLVKSDLIPGGGLLYLCGETRTSDIEVCLSNTNFRLVTIETYRTKKVSQLTYKFESMRKLHSLDAVALFSSISAEIYDALTAPHIDDELIENPAVFCVSERAKQVLSPVHQKRTIVAEAPREDSIVAAVCDYFDRS